MYVFSYFKTEEEKLFLAHSRDGYIWKEANGGAPVWESHVGTGQLRDPFILEDHNGVFHMVWTDGWKSRNIGYARSTDLVEWTGEKLIPVMEHLPETENCWAPEIFYDTARKAYRIIWSSTVGEGPRNHRIYSAVTTDFQTFTEGRLFFDPGYNVIDATVKDMGEAYFMLFKDERGTNEQGTPNKAIRSCSLRKDGNDRPESGPISELLTPALTEGPSLFETVWEGKKEWIMLADGFQDKSYTAFRSADLIRWEPTEGRVRLPQKPRHGSVMTLEGRSIKIV